jgi:REP element-mobilizing transposase RayT
MSRELDILRRDRDLKDRHVMPRRPRIRFRDAIYHVMARGVRKSALFVDDVDRRKFLKVLAIAVERHHCICFTYSLMGNHFHLIIQTPDKNISRFMQYVDGVYGQYFNRRHKHRGHVYESRFNSPLIEDSRYLASAIAYVVRNPVEAMLVKNAAAWKWSSYRAAVGKSPCPRFLNLDWLPRLFEGSTLRESRRLFSMAVHKSEDCPEFDVSEVRGSKEFQQKVRAVIGATLYRIELPRTYRAMSRPPLDELFGGVKKSDRRAVILRAHVVHGYQLSEIARYLDLHRTTISRIVNRTGSYSILRTID